MRAFASIALCLFTFTSLSFAAPASDFKNTHKSVECEKGETHYKDKRGKLIECHKFKDDKKDFHARGFDGRASDLTFSSVNITDVGNGTEIESSGNYQNNGIYQYNETTTKLGGDNIIVYDSGRLRPGLRYGYGSCKTATTTTTTVFQSSTTAVPSDDGGDDLLHLTAIVNALPTDDLNLDRIL